MSAGDERIVLAIDPGKSKCGVAVVRRGSDRRLTTLWRGIVPPDEVVRLARQLGEDHPVSMCLVGSGTTANPLVSALRETWPQCGVLVVDEESSTLEARELYWEEKGRRGWRILLPASLQVPPEQYDDFAAVVIAHRFLSPGD